MDSPKLNHAWPTSYGVKTTWMDEGREVDIFYLHFNKAFDTVSQYVSDL